MLRAHILKNVTSLTNTEYFNFVFNKPKQNAPPNKFSLENQYQIS